jgi:hypothetical protein
MFYPLLHISIQEQAENTNFIVFSLIRQTIEPTIYRTRRHHTTAYHQLSCEFESSSWQHYLKNFVSDLRQVGGFFRVIRLPPPMQLPATI